MSTYTIIGGVNGVGKSSLTGVLLSENNNNLGIVIDTDKITAQMNGDKISAAKYAIAKINECFEKGISFTQETTLSGVRTIKTIKKAVSAGYRIVMYYVAVNSCEESISRISNRVRKGGHNIPSEDVERRYKNRFENLCNVMQYCDEVFFFDNENGFVKSAEYRNGKIIFLTDQPPQWLCELKSYINNNGGKI